MMCPQNVLTKVLRMRSKQHYRSRVFEVAPVLGFRVDLLGSG